MNKTPRGVCCTCQTTHPVVAYRPPTYDDGFEYDDLFASPSERYAMAEHDAFGKYCEGSGTMPQALCS
jgi:hypothetical protein